MDGIISRLIKSRIAPERYGWSGHFRWPLMSIAVGMVSGLGAILFEELSDMPSTISCICPQASWNR